MAISEGNDGGMVMPVSPMRGGFLFCLLSLWVTVGATASAVATAVAQDLLTLPYREVSTNPQ